MRRRDLLGGSAVAIIEHRLLEARPSSSQARSRLACNSWPFRGYFDTPRMQQYRDQKLALLTQADFPEFLADHFQIHQVEYLPQHFLDTEPSTIDAIKRGLQKAKSRCCNLMSVQFEGGVFGANADVPAITEEAERWISVAVALGAPSITIALTGTDAANAHHAANNLKPAVESAHRRGLKVLFHNDDLQREAAEVLTAVISELGRERTGACPDFGNFSTKSAAFALKQLRMLAPFASNICHAKDGIAQEGKMYEDDFPASMRVMQNAGFRGVYSLEYEGLADALTGTRRLIAMTTEHLAGQKPLR